MRTSRGLQVTSLVVLSPVVLILLSLLTILTSTLFSQFQLWYPSIYTTTTTPSLSKWVSTATTTTTTTTFGHGSNSNDSLFLQTDDTTNTTSYFSSTSNSNPSHYRPSSAIHVWLKRWRHSKRKSPSLWTLCGLVLLIGYVYLHKSHVQKRQVSRYLFKFATFLTRGLASLVTCCGKQTMVFWKDHVSGNKQEALEDLLWLDNDKNINTKSPYAKQKHQQQNARAATLTPILAPTPTTHQQRHHAKKVKKRQRSSSIKQSSVPSSNNNNKQQRHEPSLPAPSMTTTENKSQDSHVESNDWISVGDSKKKKDSVQPPQSILNHDHEDYDDDDKTMVDEMDTMTSSKSDDMIETPATSDDDEMESLDTTTTPIINNNNNNNINHHHHHHHHHEPMIRNWYSPFSTGLDLDILPREDPLVMLDPMQLRKHDDHYHHYHHFRYHDDDVDDVYHHRRSDNFSLLQNHPFIAKKQHLQDAFSMSSSSSSSPPLGAIGQPHTTFSSTSSSHVQNSTRHPFSLFI